MMSITQVLYDAPQDELRKIYIAHGLLSEKSESDTDDNELLSEMLMRLKPPPLRLSENVERLKQKQLEAAQHAIEVSVSDQLSYLKLGKKQSIQCVSFGRGSGYYNPNLCLDATLTHLEKTKIPNQIRTQSHPRPQEIAAAAKNACVKQLPDMKSQNSKERTWSTRIKKKSSSACHHQNAINSKPGPSKSVQKWKHGFALSKKKWKSTNNILDSNYNVNVANTFALLAPSSDTSADEMQSDVSEFTEPKTPEPAVGTSENKKKKKRKKLKEKENKSNIKSKDTHKHIGLPNTQMQVASKSEKSNNNKLNNVVIEGELVMPYEVLDNVPATPIVGKVRRLKTNRGVNGFESMKEVQENRCFTPNVAYIQHPIQDQRSQGLLDDGSYE